LNIAMQIISIADRPTHGPEAVFGPAGGTIGRRSDNTLVIPDATRHVSRLHATVFWSQGAFRIRDQGSFLPVYVNGRGIGFQRDMILRAGDRIQIGPYVLLVSEADPSRAVTGPGGIVGPRQTASLEAPAATVESVPTFEEIQARLAAAKAAGHQLTKGSGHAGEPEADADAATTQSLHAGQSSGNAVGDRDGDRPPASDTANDQRPRQPSSGRHAVGLSEAARALLRWRD
jgi:FHA domain-containing protein/type VI secretion system protein